MVPRIPIVLSILIIATITACGPDTIFLRPALDTPEQHVQNGHDFLSMRKIDAASNEFERAKSLDAQYAPAFVGIGLVQGHRGDFKKGFESMAQARDLAENDKEMVEVDNGIKTLEAMQKQSEEQ